MYLHTIDILGDDSIVLYYPFVNDANEYAEKIASNNFTIPSGFSFQPDPERIQSIVNEDVNELTNTLNTSGRTLKSASFWMKPTLLGVVFDINRLYFSFGYNADRGYFYIGANGGNYGLPLPSWVSDVSYFLNRWSFIVLTATGGGTKVYLDGQYWAEISYDVIGQDGNSIRVFKGFTYNGEFSFQGRLQNLRFFDRYLTESDITRIYNIESKFVKGVLQDKNTMQTYVYDYDNHQLNPITTGLSESDIISNGFVIVPGMEKNIVSNKKLYIAVESPEKPTKLLIDNIPKPQLIVQNTNINLSGFDVLQNVTISEAGINGYSKWLVSPDNGNSWHYWNGTSWVLFKSGDLLETDIPNILSNGMSTNIVNALDSSNLTPS
jgi:hypothetical protein